MNESKSIPTWALAALSERKIDRKLAMAAEPIDLDFPPDCMACVRDLPLLVVGRLALAECAAPMQHLMGCMACAKARERYAREFAEAQQVGEEAQLVRRWEATRTMWVPPDLDRQRVALQLAAELAADEGNG